MANNGGFHKYASFEATHSFNKGKSIVHKCHTSLNSPTKLSYLSLTKGVAPVAPLEHVQPIAPAQHVQPIAPAPVPVVPVYGHSVQKVRRVSYH